MEITSNTFRESIYDILEALQKHGTTRKIFTDEPYKSDIYGGENCIEISPLLNIINDPLELFPIIPGRGNHFIMQIAETIWVLNGKSKISEFFGQFASSSVQKFAEGEDDLHAAYGPRLFSQPEGKDLVDGVIKALSKKKLSRSAIIPLFNAEMDSLGAKHKPCATTVQFHVYNNKLDCILTLRANDIIKGYSAINFLEFAFLQAIVAFCLDIPVGRFLNFTTTMHYYSGPASKRVENILKLKPNNHPDLSFKISELFDYGTPLGDRYSSIMQDAGKIYQSLRTKSKKEKTSTLVHPIFKSFHEILSMHKFDHKLDDTFSVILSKLKLPLLENQHKVRKSEVEEILNKNLSNHKKIITWRNH